MNEFDLSKSLITKREFVLFGKEIHRVTGSHLMKSSPSSSDFPSLDELSPKTIKNLHFLFLFLISAFFTNAQTITEKIPGTEVSFQMVMIPEGTFQINNRTIKLDAFHMGIHEVTWDEFSIFEQRDNDNEQYVDALTKFDVDGITRPTPMYEDFSKGMGKKGGFPAVSMTQQAALRYCEWLWKKTGQFYRLPTEAEWEYACRAGTETDFHFGNDTDDLEDYDWFYENGDEKYHKVGQKKPNPWGLFDMHGNVSEWTLDDYREDYFEEIEGNPAVNPWNEPKLRHHRTVKGGSYYTDAEECTCAFRLKSKPRWQMRDPQIPKSEWWNTDSPFVGFRLVRPVKKMTVEEIEAFFERAIVE